MKTDATHDQIDRVIQEIARQGPKADVSRDDYKTIIGLPLENVIKACNNIHEVVHNSRATVKIGV
jgi:hypothetical protein